MQYESLNSASKCESMRVPKLFGEIREQPRSQPGKTGMLVPSERLARALESKGLGRISHHPRCRATSAEPIHISHLPQLGPRDVLPPAQPD